MPGSQITRTAVPAVVLAGLVVGGIVAGLTGLDGDGDGGRPAPAVPDVPPLRDPATLAPPERSGGERSGSRAEQRPPGEVDGSAAAAAPAPGTEAAPPGSSPIALDLPIGNVPVPDVPGLPPLEVPSLPTPISPPSLPVTGVVTVAVEDVPGNPAMDALVVFVDGQPVERFEYADTDIGGLVAQVNAGSRLITATLLVDGVPLAHTGPVIVDQDGSDLAAAVGALPSPLQVAVRTVSGAVSALASAVSSPAPADDASESSGKTTVTSDAVEGVDQPARDQPELPAAGPVAQEGDAAAPEPVASQEDPTAPEAVDAPAEPPPATTGAPAPSTAPATPPTEAAAPPAAGPPPVPAEPTG